MFGFVVGIVVGVALSVMFVWAFNRWDDYKFQRTMKRRWGGS